LAAFRWGAAIVAGASFILLLAGGMESFWIRLSVAVSAVVATVLVTVGHRHRGARFGLPLQDGIGTSVATTLAVVLTVLQLSIGAIEVAKELGGPNGATAPTTIINQRICPDRPEYGFPHERS
jgi:hypothetical protein